MATDARADLRTIVDTLADDDLEHARDLLTQLKAARERDTWAEFDAWLIKSGLVSRLPQAAANPPIERTPLLKISGESVSKTLVDERR